MDLDLRNLFLAGITLAVIIVLGIILTPPGEGTIKACSDACPHTGRAMLKMDKDRCSCESMGTPPPPK